MNSTQIVELLERLGALTIGSTVIGVLARGFFNKALDVGAEALKARVAQQNAIALERVRSDLAVLVHETQQRSASLVSRQIDAVETMYQLLTNAESELASILDGSSASQYFAARRDSRKHDCTGARESTEPVVSKDPDRLYECHDHNHASREACKYIDATPACRAAERFIEYFEQRRIYFAEDLVALLVEIREYFRRAQGAAMSKELSQQSAWIYALLKDRPDHELEWDQLKPLIIDARQRLEREFRALYGVSNGSSSLPKSL